MGCAEPDTTPGSGTAKAITVQVVGIADAKTIAPSGGADVSHYKITVRNEAEDVEATSGHLDRGEDFTVTNVPAGLWTATVDAFVLSGGDYIKVASASSAETRVEAGEMAVLTVTLDTLDDSVSGDVTVTLDMPAELDDEGDNFHYTYVIAGTGQRSGYSHSMSTPAQGTVDASGNGSFTIDVSELEDPLYQGAYLLTVTVFDKESEDASDVVRKGVDVMRLVNGLPASGIINLNSQIIVEDGFQIAVVDRIGDRIDLSSGSWTASSASINIAYDGTADDISVYIDGVPATEDSYVAVPEQGSPITFTFNQLASGRHVLTFIADESDTELGVGSLSVEVNIPVEIGFNPVP